MDVFGKLSQYDFGEVHFRLDKATHLKAIVAIHDSRLGPALGGCRFIEYDTDEAAYIDALRLARGMTYKAALAGLAHGGGKSVIIRPKGRFDRVAGHGPKGTQPHASKTPPVACRSVIFGDRRPRLLRNGAPDRAIRAPRNRHPDREPSDVSAGAVPIALTNHRTVPHRSRPAAEPNPASSVPSRVWAGHFGVTPLTFLNSPYRPDNRQELIKATSYTDPDGSTDHFYFVTAVDKDGHESHWFSDEPKPRPAKK